MKIQAVLFDCDGLMFNTEVVSQNMWREIAKNYDSEITDSFFVTITGARKGIDLSSFEQEIPHLKEIMQDMYHKRFDLSFWKSFYPDGLNKKGLIELKSYLDQKGIRTAVCSSSHKEYVETLIQTASIPLKFDTIICGDMVKNGKPDPEIFLTGAEVLGVKPENCLVLEDSKQGILAAYRAHMHSCFIQDTIQKDDEMSQWIDHECKDLEEVITLLKDEGKE